ncbi:MAG: AAA family ATPase [bacterium]
MKKQKILVLKGLPGSGKSSWAKDFVAKSNGKAKRINKDDLRAMLDNSVYSKPNEKMILDARDTLVELFLTEGIETIIIDDTNFEAKHFDNMRVIADAFDALIEVEYKEFLDVTVDECIHRDSKRPNPVGEKVIRDMYNRYIAPTIQDKYTNIKNGNTIICDIDGCAAHRTNRNWFDLEKVHTDEPDSAVRNIVNNFYDKGYTVLFVSGREGTDICKKLTQQWLVENGFKHHALYMRKENDYRQDAIIKQEIYEQFIKDKYIVEFVLDDRDQVCKKWRELGLKCLQVQPGNF